MMRFAGLMDESTVARGNVGRAVLITCLVFQMQLREQLNKAHPPKKKRKERKELKRDREHAHRQASLSQIKERSVLHL